MVGPKIKKSWNFEVLVPHIIKSKFYWTKIDQNNPPEHSNLLFKYNFYISNNKMTKKRITVFVSISPHWSPIRVYSLIGVLKWGKLIYAFFGIHHALFVIFYSILRVLIIPKWLTNVPVHIPICFRWFMELPRCSPNLASYTLYLSPEYFKKYKKIWKHPSKHIISSYRIIWEFQHFDFVWPYQTSKMWNLFWAYLFVNKTGGPNNNWFLLAFSKTSVFESC